LRFLFLLRPKISLSFSDHVNDTLIQKEQDPCVAIVRVLVSLHLSNLALNNLLDVGGIIFGLLAARAHDSKIGFPSGWVTPDQFTENFVLSQV